MPETDVMGTAHPTSTFDETVIRITNFSVEGTHKGHPYRLIVQGEFLL
jgi:hypothetical protein